MPEEQEAQQMDAVKTNTITISAATPDVLAAVCREITQRVMSLIPQDALQTIAEQVLRDGKIVVERKHSYSGSERVTLLDLADFAKERTVEFLKPAIVQLVQDAMNRPEFKEHVHTAVLTGVLEAVKRAPNIAASMVTERIVTGWVGSTELQSQLMMNVNQVGLAVGELLDVLKSSTSLNLNHIQDPRNA